jgi:hypothetical protein
MRGMLSDCIESTCQYVEVLYLDWDKVGSMVR